MKGNSSSALEDFVKRGQDVERQQSGANQSANHDTGERLLDFASWSGCKEHRHETERRHAGRDQDGSQPKDGAFDHSQFYVHSFAPQFVEVAHHDDAVEHRDAEQCDEADARADAEIKLADDERENPADQRERNVQDDQDCLLDRIEGTEQQKEDRSDRDRDYDREALHRALLILKLTAPGHEITGWKFDDGVDLLFRFFNKAAEVASSDIALDDDPSLRHLAADLGRPLHDIYFCKLAERNKRFLG